MAIIAGALSLLFFGPLTLSYGLIIKKADKFKEYEILSRAAIENLNNSRALLQILELESSDTSALKENIMSLDRLLELEKAYLKFSWAVPGILSVLYQEKCKSKSTEDKKCKCCDNNKSNVITSNNKICNTQECACYFMNEDKVDEIDELDILYNNYILAYESYYLNNGSAVDRKAAAEDFYTKGRKFGCMIIELSTDIALDVENATIINYSCSDILDIYLE